MTRNAVPHGPTSPLSDDQPHPGTRGPSEPSGREIAAEGRAGGPTEREIRAWVRAVDRDERAVETLTDQLGGIDAWVRAVLGVTLPLIEARLREQIAGEIEALPRAPFAQDRYARKLAARFVRGEQA